VIYFWAFMAGFLVDVFYTWWIRAIAVQAPLQSGVYSMLVTGTSLVGFTSVVDNHYAAAPYLLGMGLGSALAVKYGRN